MTFHGSYSNLLSQLPPSLINTGWIRFTTRKRNPLSESEAGSINPIIESFLKHEVNRYQEKKQHRYNPTQHIQSFIPPSVLLEIPKFEKEINTIVSILNKTKPHRDIPRPDYGPSLEKLR